MFSVKLKEDIQGGYGKHPKGHTLENLTLAQATTLFQSGLAEEPKEMKGEQPDLSGPATTSETVDSGKAGKAK